MNNDINTISDIKARFKDALSKGTIISWSKLIAVDVTELNHDIKQHLHAWYHKIINHDFFNLLPDTFEEVFIHSADDIKIKSNQSLLSHYQEMTTSDIDLSIEVLCIKNNIDWNYSNPFASFYVEIKDKMYRATLTHKKISPLNKSKYFFRLISKKSFPLSSFKTIYNFEELIKSKKNILVAGATGSGKTSFINCLINFIDTNEHLVILEDTFELQTDKENTTRLISAKENDQTLDKLLTYTLRMSPERMIVGELRSNEITTFVQALNTGHKGVMSTIHANNAKDAVHRAAILFQLHSGLNINYNLALKLISANIDYVVYLKDKTVTELIQIYSSEGENLFFDEVA